MAGLAARLLALHELHAGSVLTDDEFARAKARVIAEHQDTPPPATAQAPPPVPTPHVPTPPVPAPAAPPPTLNPVVPGVGLALGAAAGGLGG